MRDGLALAAVAGLAALVSCAGRAGPRAPVEAGGAGACPHDAVAVAGGCRCAPGLFVLEGACVGPRELDAYCGVSGRATRSEGACAAPVCRRGDPIALATGACAPARTARAIFARVRPVPDDLELGCHEGRVLVLDGRTDDDASLACLARADVCPRATAWDPAAARCISRRPCAPGEVRGDVREEGEAGDAGERAEAGAGAATDACIRVVTRGARGDSVEPVVEVGQWSRAMLGADGGDGTLRLCRALAGRPAELDVGPGGARTLALTIELRFPDNDVSQVSASVEVLDAASRLPLFGAGARAGQKAVEALLVPLRALGGGSDAASATLHVRCSVRGGGTPFLFPRGGP